MRKERPNLLQPAIDKFISREEKALKAIRDSSINYLEVGIFGSYARNDYNMRSDIDILVVIPEYEITDEMSILRERLDISKVQVVYSTPDVFTGTSLFDREIQRDYIRKMKRN